MALLMKNVLFLTVILVSVLAVDIIPSTAHKKVIQANHFYSDTELTATYKIQNVEKARSLIFVLRDKKTSQGSLSIEKNNIKITMKAGNQKSQCMFDSYDDLCVVKQVGDNKQSSLQIKCSKLPCDLSWTIFQPIPQTNLKQTQPLQELYELSNTNKHMIAIVSCNNPEIKSFKDDVRIYSNNPFSVTRSKDIIYYLFNNEKKGYMFAEVASTSKPCATLGIYNVSDLIHIQQKSNLRDFILNDSLSTFKLDEIPSTDFMIDGSFHELNKSQIVKSGLEIKLTAQNIQSKQRQTIDEQIIRPYAKKTDFPFKYIIKTIQKQKYKNVQIEFKSTASIIMLNFILNPENRFQLNLGEVSYFNLKKGQKLLYKLPANTESDANQLAYIYPSNKNSLKSNETSCKIKSGCEFQIQATNDIQASLYLGQNQKQDTVQTVYNQFKKQITKKAKQGQIHYYKTSIQPKKAFQLVVNSPNVIIYLATPTHCPQTPSEQCYENVFNYHNPTIYEPEVSGELILAVNILDNCEYTITRINEDQEYIVIKQGQPFSYLMDDMEQKVIFKFKLDKKQQVNFNLISPLNSLYLLVQNGQKAPNPQDMNLASTDGYISLSKNQIDSLYFTIMILKADDFKKKFVHFTLVASTKNTNMKLEPGIAHYETIQPEQHRDWVFEFQPKDQYIVTFYTHNAKAKQKVNIQMMVSNKDEWTNIKKQHSFIIDRQTDVLQLKDVSAELCVEAGSQSCEIFVRVINTMDSQIDLTINLMIKNSIIQLKDGIWQSYAENAIAISSNFYFYPKNKDRSIQIMYRSLFTDLRISYAIWKADDKNIDPTEWPFPKTIPKQNKQNQVNLYRPTKHVSIDHSVLKQCWPSCVVLISLIKNSTMVQGEFQKNYLSNGQFAIMASNSYIEIPQKTKIEAVLKQNEGKYFLIDLKYALEKQDQTVTIFSYTTIGYYELKGNVYSQKNPRCPSEDEESDFIFGKLQTQIKVSTIQKKIQENQMTDDRNLYICILAKAYTNTKLALQYNTNKDTIKVLDLDSYQTVAIDKDKVKIYQISANQQFYIKFTRNKGFPFVDVQKCKQTEDFEDCLDKFIDKKQKGKQLVSKTESFDEQPCQNCLIFIKISGEQPGEVDIHLQSKYTEMQLKQGKMISDFTNQNQQNRYTITALRNQETIINIQVTEGIVQVQVHDFNKINITKKSTKDQNLVHIVIPPQDHQNRLSSTDKTSSVMGMPWMTSYGLSDTFSVLHLSIKPAQVKGATAYTITYSSGQRQTYLQDGLITDYILQPEKQTKFIYENQNNQGHGYLSISMQNSADLHNLNLKMYYMVDGQDQDTAVEIPADMPPMRKKTPNPTILYNLPAKNFIVIVMKNPSSKQQKISIGVNHQQVILLPFEHDFSFPLHKKQQINLLVDVNNPGYVKLTIRKCDQSNPEFSYTFDYDGFSKGQFTYTSILNDDPKFQYYIKAKQVGTLYIRFKSEEDDDSLLAIKAEYSPEKIKGTAVKPGNRGILQYQLLDSATAQITFTEAVCSGKDSLCKKQFDYFTISSSSQQTLYTQTVCPTHYFATAESTSIEPLPMNKIKPQTDSNGKIMFKYTLLDHISYVGVKGINKRTGEQVYYRPIQIVTIWGQISRTSVTHRFTLAGLTICGIFILLLCCRKHARKGYKPLEEED